MTCTNYLDAKRERERPAITVWTYEDFLDDADSRDDYDRTRGGYSDYWQCEHCGAWFSPDDPRMPNGDYVYCMDCAFP